MRRRQSEGKAAVVAVAAIALLMMIGAGAFVWLFASAPEPPRAATVVKAAPEGASGQMSEEERLKYIEANIRVSNLSLGPDMMPDREEEVPGLMRVAGEISNSGDRTIHKVTLAVFPEDSAGKVVGSYYQNIVPKSGLKGGEVHSFKFQIPKRGELSGKFKHELR